MKTNLAALIPVLFVLTLAPAGAAVRYVNLANPSPVPPYTEWATAATNIQDAIDAAMAGDEIVVTNGVYATSGRAVNGYLPTNRVAVTKPVTVRSVNGPAATVIAGYQVPGTTNGDAAVRCVYLTNGAVLAGFTMTNGATRSSGTFPFEQTGGGVWCESRSAMVSNCVLTGNAAWDGGGASSGTLNNCLLTHNDSGFYGGGAFQATLNNCTLMGNSAFDGGGAYGSTLRNCIVYFNAAVLGGDNYTSSTLDYCCTTPAGGVGNINAEPQLTGDFHLTIGSPCRGAGNASYASGTDIDGEPWANPPSIGCDEYHAQGPLTVAMEASHTNVAPGFVVDFDAHITGQPGDSRWDYGDGTMDSNRLHATHSWLVPGDYFVTLRVFNATYPEGVSATLTVRVWVQPMIHYVALDSSIPVAPYSSWANAATNIQDAIDVAEVGAEIVVANGVYATGGRAVFGTMTNRVAVTKPVKLRSMNGPEVTMIRGYQVPGTTNANSAVRCVYLGAGATLVGFTLTNGATISSGDLLRERSGGGVWCEAASALVSNCTFSGNSASYNGGGILSSTLYNCTLTGNSARGGSGGGAYAGTLKNCTLTGNSAVYGGGVAESSLFNCTLTGNSGGGAYIGTLNNCTLTANSGIGAIACTLNNCIVFFNTGANYSGSTFAYSCTTPLPDGVGNIDANPQLTSDLHLWPSSPCIGAGSSAYATGTDIDGEPWANPPCMGADQRMAGSAIGPLNLSIAANYSRVGVGYPVTFAGRVSGPFLKFVWDFGDGTGVTNQDTASHSWNAPGLYAVQLIAYNDSFPDGVATNVLIEVSDGVHHVNQANTTPVYPFTSWATAATNIQDAIDAAAPGLLVLVSNGVYQTGGRAIYGTMTNRVAVTKPVTVRSVNGPEVTKIQGYQVPGSTRGNGDGAVRCVYLANGAALVGFTLTNGATRASGDLGYEQIGGGVYCGGASGLVSNCVLTGNSAREAGGGARSGTLINCIITGNSAAYGGGAEGSTLNNCTLTGNLAGSGGGVWYGLLNNCTLTGNSAGSGGGVFGGTLNNCIVYHNTATQSGSNYNSAGTVSSPSSIFNYSCTTPLAPGVGNLAEDPQLLDASHLSETSPCLGRGNPAYVTGVDTDGQPWAFPPSMGCDEIQPVTGPLTVAVSASSCSASPGSAVTFTAQIAGRATAIRWDFGDGGGGAARCVYLSHGGAALSGFTLTHGVADTGGGVWCLDGNTTVSNCVIVDNSASSGGGAYGGTLNNCTLTGNSALAGGGVNSATLSNCVLTENSAHDSAGGALGGTLNNCTLIGNWANQSGGGVGAANFGFFWNVPRLNNCLVYYNFAGSDGDNFDSFSELNGSCTTPLPLTGLGNFENRPRLVNLVGGDFRLRPDSPCINAGLNAYATDGIDLDGNPRIVGGTVDVGAYEFQSPQSLLSYAWLHQFGLPTDGSSDNLDLDGDLFSNFQEWRAGTDPTDAFSALRLLTPVVGDLGLVTWESVPGRTYSLERSEVLDGFQSFVPVATGIPAAPDGKLTTYFDSGADLFAASWFYCVLVE